jgi:nucleoside-diphosphate-sugar epimerase
MKLLVTGGAGYVGSVLVPELLAAGHSVRVLDNLAYGQRSLLQCFANRAFEFVRGDVRNEATLSAALQSVDLIIHLAAVVGEPACRRSPGLAEQVNLRAVELLDRLRRRDQKIIFASTTSNYGVQQEVCDEQSSLNPISQYAITKAGAERLLLDAGNVVAFRFASAFGMSPRLRLDLLVNDFVWQAVKNDALIVYESHFRRTFIHVNDMVRSFLFAIDHYGDLLDGVYNVGHEDLNFSKAEIAMKIRERRTFFLYFADTEKDPDQRNYEVRYEKIRSKGFSVTRSVDDGIEELIRGYEMVSIGNPFSNTEG